MGILKSTAIGSFLLVLAGCVSNTGGDTAQLSSYYTPNVVRYAARDGVMLVTAHGDFGIPLKQANREIANNLSMPGWFAPTEFIAASPSAAPDEHRVVFIVNPMTLTVSGRHACAATKPLKTKPIAETVRIVGAFCAGRKVISEVTVSGAGGFPGDLKFRPDFREHLDNIVGSLMPSTIIFVPSG